MKKNNKNKNQKQQNIKKNNKKFGFLQELIIFKEMNGKFFLIMKNIKKKKLFKN